jgi:Fe-S-cluster-containing dehydrogenase component
MKVALNGAVYRRADGIVMIDPEKSKGQKQIVSGCPYRVIEWNEEKQVPQKCILCAHMLDKGEKVPRCVESCPTGALVFGDLDNPQSEIAKLVAGGKTEVMHPEYGMKDKVRYIALPRTFIAGTVILGDVDEVAKGAVVKLEGKGSSQEAVTNGFGDFEFEGLPSNSDYSLKVEAAGYKAKSLKVKTQKDTYVGEIVLKK